jgi:DNA-binding MarR family transcriptional regulator
LERELGLLMRRSASLNREVAADVHPDLDGASYSTLARIEETSPARACDLCEYFGVDKSAVSRQVTNLEHLGLVARAVDPLDARARVVLLTQEGVRRLRQVRRARRARFHGLMSSWPRRDVEDMARMLGALNRLL